MARKINPDKVLVRTGDGHFTPLHHTHIGTAGIAVYVQGEWLIYPLPYAVPAHRDTATQDAVRVGRVVGRRSPRAVLEPLLPD